MPDYLYVNDGEKFTAYTGKSLAGKTVIIPGDTLKLILSVSGYSDTTDWGFAIKDIHATAYKPQPTPPVAPPAPSPAAKVTKPSTVKNLKLKSKKKYYVRVRAYCTDAKGKKIYGKWSAVKSSKIK